MPSLQTIESILYPYIAINSETGSPGENQAADYVHGFFASLPYFQANPAHFGSHLIAGDRQQRRVEWALVRGMSGASQKTVVLMHHFDVVEVDDFGQLKGLAFQPEALERALHNAAASLPPDVRADLESGEYLFGRGAADMKAGGSIQMTLMEAFSRQPEGLPGNLMLIAVPDEENLSAGMRAAALLLADLKQRFDLDYILMINCEPHQRKVESTGLLSGGSIGKMMPFIYVRGILAHAGKSPEGFNPLAVLSDVVRRTEMSLELTESLPELGEMTPPPTWLMARDSKTVYDVSMPLSAFGFLSVLTFSRQPQQVLDILLETCRKAALENARQANQAAASFNQATGRPPRPYPWQPEVMLFAQYLERLREALGAKFEEGWKTALDQVQAALQAGRLTTATATWALLDNLAAIAAPSQPVVIVGLLPPYYPAVCYLDRPDFSAVIQQQLWSLNQHSQSRWGQEYELEAYFTGISDLSYSSLDAAARVEDAIVHNMPLYGPGYSIPFQQISQISMPCINIGPWGKDFHKMTERVLKEDLFERTPELVLTAIETALRPAWQSEENTR